MDSPLTPRMMSRDATLRRFLGSAALAALLFACAGPSGQDRQPTFEADGGSRWHAGPAVAGGDLGTARFVPVLYEAFAPARAMEAVQFADRFYRAPANVGYEAVLDYIERDLRAIGFGETPGLELEIIEEESLEDAWTPVSARLVLRQSGGEEFVLHSFQSAGDVDRVMLPVLAPSASVTGAVALSLAALSRGDILVTEVPLEQILRRAIARGASAVLSASLAAFNEDPSGKERHLDAIQFRQLRQAPGIPVAQISPRSFQRIARAVGDGRGRSDQVQLSLDAEVQHEQRPLRTLTASIVGRMRPDEAVVIVSHVQEPGALDNASGLGGLLESGRSVVSSIRAGALEWPDRTLTLVWGDEFRQSRAWLRTSSREAVAAFSSDMIGQSAETGAKALLERMPDPGAIMPLAPDVHTPWGAGEVERSALSPNGLAVVARVGMQDVSRYTGGWVTADHPWEGGSDHDVFNARGVPAVLFWHFTDFTYHTSLDRMPFVDPEEIRRTSVALMAAALGIAAPGEHDAGRYEASVELERSMRTRVAHESGHPEIAALWNDWCDGANEWLAHRCSPIPGKKGKK